MPKLSVYVSILHAFLEAFMRKLRDRFTVRTGVIFLQNRIKLIIFHTPPYTIYRVRLRKLY